jgi:hypothetical protein
MNGYDFLGAKPNRKEAYRRVPVLRYPLRAREFLRVIIKDKTRKGSSANRGVFF